MELDYAQLRDEYERLWDTMSVPPTREALVKQVAEKAIAYRPRYKLLEGQTGVPWYWIAAAHSLETGQSFSRHLHNGDPLSARTVQVPAGRPKSGTPPFDWTESALDALTMWPHELHKVRDWSIPRMLYELERYNGWGYRIYHPATLSPYLWSFTNHYSRGKYIADGKWSDTHASTQVGAAAILQGIFTADADAAKRSESVKEEVFDQSVLALQGYLNVLGARPPLALDGKFGPKTKAAVESFQRSVELNPDGIVGPKTWAAIKLRLPKPTN